MFSRLRAAVLPLLLLILVSLPVCACAADGALAHDHVELFSEGYLPSPPARSVFSMRASTFDSYIIAKLEKQTAEIDVSSYGMDVDTFKNAYWALLNSRPDLFYVSGGFSYYHSGGIVTGLLPNYKYSGSDLKKRISAFDKGISKIVSYANQADTDIGKLLLVNDYLCVNFEYDTSYAIYSPDEMLTEGKGVCQAYMLLCRAVLNELGFRSDTATSNAMNHTWNVVCLDGSWYHLDVTWNDPLADRPLGAYHSNFLLSDSGITDSGHYSWDFSTAASNTQYDDFFWTEIDAPLSVLNDVVYYAEAVSYNQFTIKSWRIGASDSTSIFTYDLGDGLGGTFYGSSGSVWATDELIYYACCENLYSVDPKRKLVHLEYTTGSENTGVWRLFMTGGTIRMFVSSSPYSDGSIIAFTPNPPQVLALPSGTTAVKAEAFVGAAMEDVILPDGLVSLGARAFADCASLMNVYMPASLTDIATDAFEGCSEQLTFICPEGSTAQAFAQEHGFSCTLTE